MRAQEQRGTYRMEGTETEYFLCLGCGVEFQNPRPEVDKFYREGRYRQMLGQTPERVSEEGQRRARDVIAFITSRVGQVCSFLDYGSAAGDLLQAVKDTFQAQVLGVELDRRLMDYANARGRSTEAEYDEGYDLVAVVHVLEHLPWPVETLRELRRAATGWIYIEVPVQAYVEAHLMSFTPGSLRLCAELAGWTVLEVEARGNEIILWGCA